MDFIFLDLLSPKSQKPASERFQPKQLEFYGVGICPAIGHPTTDDDDHDGDDDVHYIDTHLLSCLASY